MSTNEQYPARVETFNDQQVSLIEIDGKEYLTAEDIGLCLGLAEPRKHVNQIYNRNRQELEVHKGVFKLKTPGGEQEGNVFSETGCNLIAMFSRSRKSKEFRLWLARLPRKHEEAVRRAYAEGCRQGEKHGVNALMGDANQAYKAGLQKGVAQSFAEGLEQGLKLLEALPEECSPQELGQLAALRRLGFTQAEVAASLGVSRDLVQRLERSLKEQGVVFPPVRQGRKRRTLVGVLVRELAESRQAGPEHPALPAPESES